MNNIEEKIWAYIDGSCTEDEQQAINLLIQTDTAYSQKYNELLKLNQEFAAIEIDEPSMAFTYNVMGAIRNQQAQIPLKTSINTYIIKGIAAFFILVILSCIIMLFIGINWPANSTSINTIALPDMKNYFNKPVLNAFLFLDTVLGLFLLDTFLRRKSALKHTQQL